MGTEEGEEVGLVWVGRRNTERRGRETWREGRRWREMGWGWGHRVKASQLGGRAWRLWSSKPPGTREGLSHQEQQLSH